MQPDAPPRDPRRVVEPPRPEQASRRPRRRGRASSGAQVSIQMTRAPAGPAKHKYLNIGGAAIAANRCGPTAHLRYEREVGEGQQHRAILPAAKRPSKRGKSGYAGHSGYGTLQASGQLVDLPAEAVRKGEKPKGEGAERAACDRREGAPAGGEGLHHLTAAFGGGRHGGQVS